MYTGGMSRSDGGIGDGVNMNPVPFPARDTSSGGRVRRYTFSCSCGHKAKFQFYKWEDAQMTMNCPKCGKENGMARKPPSPANHYHPTKEKEKEKE